MSQAIESGELPTLKILVIGSSGTGKTALVQKYVKNEFSSDLDNGTRATIGVDLFQKKLSVHGASYLLYLLDTAGQERFRSLSNSFYRNAVGVILVFDVTNRSSFLDLPRWFAEASENAMPGAVKYLVGNKTDKADRAVFEQEAREFASKHGVEYCETSAATGLNIKCPFVEVVRGAVRSVDLQAQDQAPRAAIVRIDSASISDGQAACLC